MNENILIDIVVQKMPYGKYKNKFIYQLPEAYLVWYHNKGFPQGKLGMLLNTIYEIKLNGLDYLFDPIIKKVKK